jgi:hypothetical protein
MRNLFDQYSQPENKLTHALACTLSNDRRLIRPFLKWLKIGPHPPAAGLRLVEQQVPGLIVSGEEEEAEAKGLPDACLFNEEGWALLLESKVQSAVSLGQLERHLRTAARHGYEDARVVVIAIKCPNGVVSERAQAVQWRQVYKWFRKCAKLSAPAAVFVDYMEVLESQMIADGYLKQGTLTMFDGLRFDRDSPYTHREGKRLLQLLRGEFLQRKELQALGVDPSGEGRPAITGRGSDAVWDFLPLAKARNATQFTAFPHLSLGMNTEVANAAITVPNGVKGGFRTKLKAGGVQAFRSLVLTLDAELRRAKKLRACWAAKRVLCVHQRHFPSQRSHGITDGWLEVDVRALRGCPRAGVRRQPEWIDAIYNLLIHKRSNIEFGVEVRFGYDCPAVRSREVIDLFVDTWTALKPLLDFVLSGG